jgi:GWxTD domain-containing protein
MTDHRSQFTLVVAAIVFAALSVSAQTPRGADTLSPTAIAESLKVLDKLDRAIRSNPKDAAAWHRRGMVAWALSVRDQAKPPVRGLDYTRLGRLADTSLRIAAQLEPDSTRYWVMSGRYLISSGWGPTKLASRWIFGSAIDAARKLLNPDDHAQAAIDMGRVYWRRYESRANRQLELDPGAAPRSISEAVAPLTRAVESLIGAANIAGGAPGGINFAPPPPAAPLGAINLDSYGSIGLGNSREDLMQGASQLAFKDAIATFERITMNLPPDVQGESDYTNAELLFREAYDASPAYERSLPSLAMLYAEKNRWNELATLAHGHLLTTPWDPWGWMSLGLATHRKGDDKAAAAAFDSAMVYLSPTERARLDQLERLLPPKDSARIAAMNPTDHAAIQRLYWLQSDPLWSQPHGAPRLEFLARVAFAELRWSVLELKVHGADSDRGNIHIRYGPPDKTFTIAPDINHQITDVTTVWIYNSGLMFIFVGPPAFGVARFPFDDRAVVGGLTEAQPVRWDNIASLKIDSMPMQTVRFRATADSVDVVVATHADITAIRKAAEVAAPVRAYAWWLAGGTVTAARDSALAKEDGSANVFTHRIAAGSYIVRSEASTPGSLRAGAASRIVIAGADSATGFSSRGFGMSDVLLATRIGSDNPSARRWTDLNATPLAGAHSRTTPLALVWEAYGLAASENQARYSVSITLERETGRGGRVFAEILDRLGNIVGVDRTNNRVVLRVERTTAHAETLADHVLLSLGDTPAGEYKLTVALKDAVSGRTTSRTTRLVIAE